MTESAGRNGSYSLSLSLLSDGEPSRSLCCLPPPGSSASASVVDAHQLVSGSQGGIVSTFGIPSGTTDIQPGGEGTRHPHQISSLVAAPTTTSIVGKGGGGRFGGYATGCKDGAIRLFGLDHKLVQTLEGHANAVTSLSWMEVPRSSSGGAGEAPSKCFLVSGSWDGTARVWDVDSSASPGGGGRCVAVLDGHENTVSVTGLPPRGGVGRVATGSAGVAQGNVISDHTVRIWDVQIDLTTGSGSGLVTLRHTVANDHHGPIRDVCHDPVQDKLYSCSNDGTVKIRSAVDGKAEATLAYPGGGTGGHPPMLLSVTCLDGGGTVVAGAEDGTVVVWDVSGNGREPQVVPHPNCVWDVIALPSSPQEGGASSLHHADFATACHDGHVRIFTVDPTRVAPDDELKAFEAAVAESKAKSSSGPTPEEIAKLPKWELNALQHGRSEGQVQVFNKEGKAIAAQWSAASGTWIEVGEVTGSSDRQSGTIDGVRYDHVLPIEVDVSGGGVQKLQIGYNDGENPFNTAQRFIDEHMLDQNYLAQIADYIRQRVGEGAGPTLGMGATGGGGRAAAAGGAAAGSSSSGGPVPMDVTPAAPTYAHLPVKGYRTFESGSESKSLSKIVNKIREFNTTMLTNLAPTEANDVLDGLCETLAATNRYHATTISDDELRVLVKMVSSWDVDRAFPALDLARIAVLHPDASKGDRFNVWTTILTEALGKCEESNKTNKAGTAATVAVPMLALRLASNCFKGGRGSCEAASSNLKRILDCAEAYALSTNKNVRLSVATVVLNASSYMMTHPGEHDSSPEQILSVVGTIIGSGLYEAEATVRSLVAFGTSLLVPNGGTSAKEKARSLHMSSMAVHAASQHGDKAKAVAEEIRLILS